MYQARTKNGACAHTQIADIYPTSGERLREAVVLRACVVRAPPGRRRLPPIWSIAPAELIGAYPAWGGVISARQSARERKLQRGAFRELAKYPREVRID